MTSNTEPCQLTPEIELRVSTTASNMNKDTCQRTPTDGQENETTALERKSDPVSEQLADIKANAGGVTDDAGAKAPSSPEVMYTPNNGGNEDHNVESAINAARMAAVSFDHDPQSMMTLGTPTVICPPATDPPLDNRPGETWPMDFSPSGNMIPVSGELVRPGPPIGGVDYRVSLHPYKVFVGGVPAIASERDVFDLFEREVGTVMHVQMVLAVSPGHMGMGMGMMNMPGVMPKYHKGYAFVTFQSAELKERCLTRRRYRLMDRWMEIKPMEQKPHPSTSTPPASARPLAPIPGSVSPPQFQQGDVPPANKLFVALKSSPDLSRESYSLSEHDIQEHFKHYGAIAKVVVVKDKVTGQAKGYGFVYFQEPTGPQVALMAGTEHMIGENVRVECKPFAAGPPGQSSGGPSPQMMRQPHYYPARGARGAYATPPQPMSPPVHHGMYNHNMAAMMQQQYAYGAQRMAVHQAYYGVPQMQQMQQMQQMHGVTDMERRAYIEQYNQHQHQQMSQRPQTHNGAMTGYAPQQVVRAPSQQAQQLSPAQPGVGSSTTYRNTPY